MTETPLHRATPILMLGALVLVGVAMQFLRSSHVVVAPIFTRELAISPEVLGGLSGVMLFASALIQIPGGVMMDRFGARRAMAVLLLFAIAGAVLFGLARNAIDLVSARVLLGIGTALLFMAVAAVLSRWYSPMHFPAMLGVVGGLGQIGNLLATTPMAALAEAVGWRSAFFTVAVCVAAIALLVYLIVRDAPPSSTYHQRAPEMFRETWRGVVEVMRIPQLYRLLPMSGVAWATISCILGLWGGPYLADVHGFDTIARGNVMAAMAIGCIFGPMVFGWASSRVPTPKPVIVFGVVSNILIFAILALVPAPTPAFVAVMLGALGLFGSYTSMLIAHGRRFYPERLIGRGLTVVNTAVLFGAASMQWVTGLIVGAFEQVDGRAPPEAYRTVFGVLALSLLVSLIIYLPLRESKDEVAG